MSKTILALDQATRTTGWAVFNDNKLISFGHWTETSENFGERILNIVNEIQKKINTFKPDKIYFEDIQLQNDTNRNIGVDTFKKLAQLQGAIILLCQLNNIQYEIVYSSVWRKSCNFLKGNDKHRDAQKKITQDWVLKEYNKKCTQDESDAICIGYYGSSLLENFDWSD